MLHKRRIKGIEYKDVINVVCITTIKRVRNQELLFTIEPEYWSKSKLRVLPRHKDNVIYNKMIEERLSLSYEPIKQTETLHSCIMRYVNHLKENGKVGESLKYIAILKTLDDVKITDVTGRYLQGLYTNYCKDVKSGTAAKKVIKIITTLKFAKGEGIEIKEECFYQKFKVHKVDRAGCTLEQFNSIRAIEIKDPNVDMARWVFVFQVLCRGLRIGDALTAKYTDGSHLEMIDNKTGKSNRIKITDDIREIMERFKNKYGHVFPYVKRPFENDYFWKKENIEVNTTMINRNLKYVALLAGIDINLTTHVARHTFAFIAATSGVNMFDIKTMLNHSTLSMTDAYVKGLVDQSKLDDIVGGLF